MKRLFFLMLILLIEFWSYGQSNKYDSLKSMVASAKSESEKLAHLTNLVWQSMWSFPDSALTYLQQEIRLANRLKSDAELSIAYTQYGVISYIKGNFSDAIHLVFEGLQIAEKSKKLNAIGIACGYLSEIYAVAGDFQHALEYYAKFKSYYDNFLLIHSKNTSVSGEDTSVHFQNIFNTVNLSRTYEKFNKLDSAIKFLELADNECYKLLGKRDLSIFPQLFANIYFKQGNYQKALEYYQSALQMALGYDIKKEIMEDYNGIAKSLYQLGRTDSCIYYAQKAIEQSQFVQFPIAKLEALAFISALYKAKGSVDSTNKYLELSIATKDSMFSQQKIMQLQSVTFNEQLRQQNIEVEKEALKKRIINYILISGLIIFLLIILIISNNSRQRQKAKVKIEKAYIELKATQAQLIQSEKMASLGELTAGIAHEIQNPLNFVNNFSDVNKELLVEMKDEMDKGNIVDAKAIADDIIENEEKINHHGKRADGIVKNMLQHSRTSSGQKEPTDINALANEYVRLAFHGLRAKDKSFNAKFETEFDNSIEKINIIPQDIGRVILNLINNAFYAVTEKKKQNTNGFEPVVTVTTKKENGRIEIKVKDNGNGIPQKVLDKIFQPFFTTKPTGQGTGLGLSLAYDIVTKGHGGELKVETKEGEGTEFIIQLSAT